MTNDERVRKFKEEKIVINCETEQEAEMFIRWCYENKMYWIDRNIINTNYNLYKSHTSYEFDFNNSSICFCDKEYYEGMGYQIIKYKDFMKVEEEKMTNLEWLFKDGEMDIYADNNSEYGKMVGKIKTDKLNKLINDCSHPLDILDYLLAEHKEPIEVTQMEYDVLNCYTTGKTEHGFNGIDCLRKLKEQGYFKNVDTTMKVKEILENCVVTKDD